MKRILFGLMGLAVISAPVIGAYAGKIRKSRDVAQVSATASQSSEHSYGTDPKQKLDFYPAQQRPNAPLVVFVHGGGWSRGDKGNATGQYKAPHYNALGYAFASINYRLVPDATVEQQAADLVSSVAYLRTNAKRLGINNNQIILMGHSAGAHLAALIATDPQYLRAAGLEFGHVRGVILLDGAGYDVPKQAGKAARLRLNPYEDAFGTDPVRQRALSPVSHAAAPNAAQFLILHVERDTSAEQSAALAKALENAGSNAQLNGVSGKGMRGHMEINRLLGKADYPATSIIDQWLSQRLK